MVRDLGGRKSNMTEWSSPRWKTLPELLKGSSQGGLLLHNAINLSWAELLSCLLSGVGLCGVMVAIVCGLTWRARPMTPYDALPFHSFGLCVYGKQSLGPEMFTAPLLWDMFKYTHPLEKTSDASLYSYIHFVLQILLPGSFALCSGVFLLVLLWPSQYLYSRQLQPLLCCSQTRIQIQIYVLISLQNYLLFLRSMW